MLSRKAQTDQSIATAYPVDGTSVRLIRARIADTFPPFMKRLWRDLIATVLLPSKDNQRRAVALTCAILLFQLLLTIQIGVQTLGVDEASLDSLALLNSPVGHQRLSAPLLMEIAPVSVFTEPPVTALHAAVPPPAPTFEVLTHQYVEEAHPALAANDLPAGTPYIVQAGDTLYSIALRYNIPLTLLATHNHIEDPRLIHAGYVLEIPSSEQLMAPGLIGGGADPLAGFYVVAAGDTLTEIANRFGLSLDSLALRNNLTPPYRVKLGQLINLENVLAAESPVAVAATPSPSLIVPTTIAPGEAGQGPPLPTNTPKAVPAGSSTYQVRYGDSMGGIANYFGIPLSLLQDANGIHDNTIYVGQQLIIPPMPEYALPGIGKLLWPVENRRVIKGYFYGHSAIDMLMPIGSNVIAAAGGTVETMGWHDYGYGYMIVINHGNGIKTLYAHLSNFYVEKGQEVAAGELIAFSGHTGNSTHPHLHFELIVNFQYLNPCLYLESDCQ